MIFIQLLLIIEKKLFNTLQIYAANILHVHEQFVRVKCFLNHL